MGKRRIILLDDAPKPPVSAQMLRCSDGRVRVYSGPAWPQHTQMWLFSPHGGLMRYVEYGRVGIVRTTGGVS